MVFNKKIVGKNEMNVITRIYINILINSVLAYLPVKLSAKHQWKKVDKQINFRHNTRYF